MRAELPAGVDSRYRWGRALGRETLDTLLLEQARRSGARIFQPCRVDAIEGAPGAWRCRLRAGNRQRSFWLSAGLVIDAHGSWEAIGSAADASKARRRGSDLLAFKANFSGAALAPGTLPVLALDGGYGGIVVADGGTTTLACCIRRDRLRRLRAAAPGESAGALIEAWLKRGCAGVAAALAGARRDGAWLSAGPLRPGIRLRADDRILRIGNAAGEAHPIIGEGMSMALQSAWMLCARLIAADRNHANWQASAARGYARAWRRQFAPRIWLAVVFAQLAMRPLTAAPLLAVARRWPGVLTLGARLGGKLDSAVRIDDFPFDQGAWT